MSENVVHMKLTEKKKNGLPGQFDSLKDRHCQTCCLDPKVCEPFAPHRRVSVQKNVFMLTCPFTHTKYKYGKIYRIFTLGGCSFSHLNKVTLMISSS